MRLWTLHPKYLDSKGLVACWRESLLAKKVLSGNTKGYRYHPQLMRFKDSVNPVEAINLYLKTVSDEALSRGFRFDVTKIDDFKPGLIIKTTSGQLNYEWQHLLEKLKSRDQIRFVKIRDTKIIDPNPLFTIEPGEIEFWEKTSN